MSAWDSERRQQLNEEFDRVFHEHDRLTNDLQLTENNSLHSLLQQVDQWEEDAIRKIEKTARTARNDLQRIFNNSKEHLQRELNQTVTNKLRQALEEKDKFNELDIDRWFARISEVRKQLDQFSSSIDFTHKNVIKLIKVKQLNSFQPLTNKQFEEKHLQFEVMRGHAVLDSYEGVISTARPAMIISQNRFQRGSYYFRFRVEQSTESIFFGIIHNRSPNTIHGWWNIDRRVLVGRKDAFVSALNIYNHDEIFLTLNCDAKQLFIEYPSMNKLNRMEIVHYQRDCPLPWSLLIETGRPGQCLIRLLDWGLMAHVEQKADRLSHCYCLKN